ncbi:MAG: alpha/beta fold hydrolase [Bradymonadaceae bacterium]|nr:alpha/beta fold hydrolase [Lujinxingiaceae bacterium]
MHIKESVLRPLDWAFPSSPINREVIARLPETSDSRPPLLFVHGAMHGAWCWDEHWMPAAAARGWPCYALSLRGHAGSDGGAGRHRWTLRDYVHDVMQVIATLPRPPVLIGHSMGGLVVQRVLELYPARAGVLLASLSPFGGLNMAHHMFKRHPADVVLGLVGRSVPPRHDYLYSEAMGPERSARLRARLTSTSALNQYEILLPRRPLPSKAPVIVLGGGQDGFVPVDDVYATARWYKAPVEIFSGMGHMLQLEPNWREPLDAMLAGLDAL